MANRGHNPCEQIAAMVDETSARAPQPHIGGAACDEDDENIEGKGDGSKSCDVDPDIVARCAEEPQNDTGNGQRLLAHFGQTILNVREISNSRHDGWYFWNGRYWARVGGNEMAMLAAQRTAPRIGFEASYLRPSAEESDAIEAADKAQAELAAISKGDADATAKARAAKLESLVELGKEAVNQFKKRQAARRKFAVSSGNDARLRAMLAQALPHRTVCQDKLDGDPLAFNVENGTLRFVRYEVEDFECPDPAITRFVDCWAARLDAHDPADLISRIAPVEYNPYAIAPKFLASLQRFQPNANVRHWLQKYYGYAMTGMTGEQCLLFNYGGGSNWKSTFIEIVCRVLGSYATTFKFDSIAGDGEITGAQANPDIARLPGIRLVRVTESTRNSALKDGLIKSLTSGEPILTRHNFGDFFSFYPVFKMSLSGNNKPDIGGVDHGIWRRIRFVIWPVTIEDSTRREFDEVIAELWEERSGILNWLIDGALAYLTEGLMPPQEIVDTTEEYREEMDIVGEFIKSCVIRHSPVAGSSDVPVVPAQVMYEAFVAWCGMNGHRAWKQRSFASVLSQKGFMRDRNASKRRYKWVALYDMPPPPDEKAFE